MRQLKFHEKKLLKKVDFLQWKRENNHRELQACAPPMVPVQLLCLCWPSSVRAGAQQTSETALAADMVCGCLRTINSLVGHV